VAKNAPKSVTEIIQELVDLLRAYALQETVDPIKALGMYLAWGATGAVLIASGIFFCALSALRALQTETNGTFDGVWSWAPYLIVAVALSGIIGLAAYRITHGSHREHQVAR
jgi:branched-subunit amino acid ABC-type transport system permease component